MSEKDVLKRLEACFPMIHELQKIFKWPSLSIGILDRGQVVLKKGFGICDQKTGRVPDEETIYSVGSCTKSFTGTSLSLLAHEGKISWSEPISEHIRPFATPYSPDVGKKANLKDILSHSTGLADLPFAVVGKGGQVFARNQDVQHICSHLPKSSDFRSEWRYNNWPYALAGTLVAQKSGASWGSYVKEAILKELGMHRTFTSYPPDDNFARAYIALDNGDLVETELPNLVDRMAFDASGAIRTCINDMLIWAKAIIAASSLESEPSPETHASPTSGFEIISHKDLDGYTQQNTSELLGEDSSWMTMGHLFSRVKRWLFGTSGSAEHIPKAQTVDNPTNHTEIENNYRPDLLKALKSVAEPHFTLASDPKQAYALGLFSFSLPTEEINTVTNVGLITTKYEIGLHSPRRRAFGHTGELGGFLAALWTFPDTGSAVIVLTNSHSHNGDSSNIVAQVLIQALFDLKPEIDFLKIAREIVGNAHSRWEKTLHNWTANRTLNTRPSDLSAYQGTYICEDLCMRLDITSIDSTLGSEKPTALQLRINELPEQDFLLSHYDYDNWTFMSQTRDECLAKGFHAYIGSWESFIIKFLDRAGNSFQSVEWRLGTDARVGPQIFRRYR